MAVLIDNRIIQGGSKKNTVLYGPATTKINSVGFLKLADPKDLAQLVIKAFIESPQYLQTYANEAAAVAANVKSGTIYKTATGEIRVKL